MVAKLMKWGCGSLGNLFGCPSRRKTAIDVTAAEVQCLEDRELPTGIVAITVVDNDVVIKGDQQNNDVTVTKESNGKIFVQGNGTLLSYQGKMGQRFEMPGNVEDVVADMGKGADRIKICGARPGLRLGRIEVNGGGGNDTIEIDQLHSALVSVSGGKGSDSIFISNSTVSSDLTIDGKNGADSIHITATEVSGLSRIKFSDLDEFYSRGFRPKGGLDFGD